MLIFKVSKNCIVNKHKIIQNKYPTIVQKQSSWAHPLIYSSQNYRDDTCLYDKEIHQVELFMKNIDETVEV